MAENRLAFYKAIDQENPHIEELEERVKYLRFYVAFDDKERAYDDFPEFMENIPPVTDRVNPPVFYHPEIHQLYQLGFKNAMPVFDVILALPRVTVIQDLELVLQDGIERYPYFLNNDWSVFTHSFALHALFLLTELKSTESLAPILNFLQYEEQFLELYIGDFLTEELWQCVYILGREKEALLKDFLLKPGVYTYAKAAVSQAIIQISFLEPHRSKEIEQLYKEVLSFFINAKEEDNVIDPTFLGLMIGDIANVQLKVLFPLIEKLYDLDYIDQTLEGDFECFIKNQSEYTMEETNSKIQTLSEIYSSSDFCEESEPKKELHQTPKNESKVIQMPVGAVKVNRNDPCLCGSGKKYKKCCGQV